MAVEEPVPAQHGGAGAAGDGVVESVDVDGDIVAPALGQLFQNLLGSHGPDLAGGEDRCPIGPGVLEVGALAAADAVDAQVSHPVHIG